MGMPRAYYGQPSERRAFAMWIERQNNNRSEEPPAVRCQGCGAYHADDEWCGYCGNGRPSVPKIKRSHPK